MDSVPMNEINPEKQGLFLGWQVVAAAFLISAVTVGAFYSFGVFFIPMIREFGWSRGLTSGVVLVGGLTYAAVVPLTGWLADRYGFKPVTAVMAGILGLGFVLSSQVNSLWQLYLFVGFLPGLGAPAAIALPLAMVARWFNRRQGLALGLASAGIGAGTAILPLLTAFFITAHGWRTSYALLGVIVWLVCIPAGLIAMHRPEPEYIQAHEAKDPAAIDPPAPAEGNHEFSLGEALTTRPFWSLFAVFAICIFGLGLAMTHLVPYALDMGLPPVTAAALLSILGIFSIIGRIVSGMISDRAGAKPVFFVCLAIQGLMMLWLIEARAPWTFFLFAALFGFSYGGNIVLVPKLAARIFGLRSMGAIFGGLSVADGLGYGTGPFLAGYIFDQAGRYDSSFLLVAAGMALAIILTLWLKEEPAVKPGGRDDLLARERETAA